jgi:hypothetical protein
MERGDSSVRTGQGLGSGQRAFDRKYGREKGEGCRDGAGQLAVAVRRPGKGWG